MVLKTLPWDVADYLTDDKAMAGYLDAALEDGDPKLVAAALSDIARAKGITDLAARTGLSRDELERSLAADGTPEFFTIMRIVDALGLQLTARNKVATDAA